MFWAIVFIVLLVIEIATVNLVTVWFAVGALAAFISATLTDNLFIQISVFVFVSIISVIATRPIVKKYFRPHKDSKFNVGRVIGKSGVVVKEVTKTNDGEVKVDGKLWTAVADKEISVGKNIVVEELKGIKLVVKEEN